MQTRNTRRKAKCTRMETQVRVTAFFRIRDCMSTTRFPALLDVSRHVSRSPQCTPLRYQPLPVPLNLSFFLSLGAASPATFRKTENHWQSSSFRQRFHSGIVFDSPAKRMDGFGERELQAPDFTDERCIPLNADFDAFHTSSYVSLHRTRYVA